MSIRSTILAAAFVLAAAAAHGGPNWQVTTFTTTPQNIDGVVAATDALMASEAGKAIPGSLAIMASLLDGADPATHSFISSFDSIAQREEFVTKLQADPAWATFVERYQSLAQPGATSRMNRLQSWGEESDADVVWSLYAFQVTDAAAFQSAVDTFLTSETGKKNTGQVVLSSVRAGGITKVTHIIGVGFESEAEAEVWDDYRVTTPDWTAYTEAANPVSDFLGAFVIRTVKTWGGSGD